MNPEPSLVGESEKQCSRQDGSENVWFLGCCDANDVIDGEECIISIMRGLGGNVNSLLPGVGVHVRKGGGQRDAKSDWNASRKGRCASPPVAI